MSLNFMKSTLRVIRVEGFLLNDNYQLWHCRSFFISEVEPKEKSKPDIRSGHQVFYYVPLYRNVFLPIRENGQCWNINKYTGLQSMTRPEASNSFYLFFRRRESFPGFRFRPYFLLDGNLKKR